MIKKYTSSNLNPKVLDDKDESNSSSERKKVANGKGILK